MANQGVATDEQQLKRRAMRRLAVALTLIALAIAGLAVLDRYHTSLKKPELASVPPEPQAPPEPAMRLPAPSELLPTQQTQPPRQQTPQVSPPKQIRQPPPPPPVVSNEPLPRAESSQPAPKATAEVPEDTAPAVKPGPAPSTSDKAAQKKEPAPPATAKTVEQQPGKGFVVQVGVFATAEHARTLQAKLTEKGIPSYTETRVVVGPFKDRAEADAVTKQLKELGLQGVVVAH